MSSFFDLVDQKLLISEKTEVPLVQKQTPSIPTCSVCGDREWWIAHGSTEPRCFHCRPSPSPSLVGKHFFFDDHGSQWAVVASNGREEWIKR
jgi:hypothetical protein